MPGDGVEEADRGTWGGLGLRRVGAAGHAGAGAELALPAGGDRHCRCGGWRPTGLTLVFCEVKCRSGLGFGHPLEAITYAKMRTLRQLAAVWMREHRMKASAIRLDAIGVVLDARPASRR